jgi:hypothetical protein
LISETQYEYDLKGNLSQKRGLNALNKEDYTLLNEYNTSGLLAKSTYFRGGVLVSKLLFDYDALQNKIKETYYESIKEQTLYTKEWVFECK